MRATLNLIIAIGIVITVGGCSDAQPVPTDAQMIRHFEENSTLFEELCLMITSDNLRHYPQYASEIRDSVPLPISAARALAYDSLMAKVQIQSFCNFNPFQTLNSENSILFDFFVKGDATWGIERGFEYVFDRDIESKKEFTEQELYDTAMERFENCELYKKIDDKWNLFFFYDR